MKETRVEKASIALGYMLRTKKISVAQLMVWKNWRDAFWENVTNIERRSITLVAKWRMDSYEEFQEQLHHENPCLGPFHPINDRERNDMIEQYEKGFLGQFGLVSGWGS